MSPNNRNLLNGVLRPLRYFFRLRQRSANTCLLAKKVVISDYHKNV